MLGGILGLVTGRGSDMNVAGTEKFIQIATSSHANAGNRAAEPTLAVWDGRWNRSAIADVKLLRDLPASIALQGSGFVSARVIGAAPVVLAVLAREFPSAGWALKTTLARLLFRHSTTKITQSILNPLALPVQILRQSLSDE